MASFMTEFKHLEIQLGDILSATQNFHESKVIGVGGFGKVYAGELSLSQSGVKTLVAIKRLDRRYGQGDPEFFKEIRMLSCYRHENLISLLGFCKQGGEMILIYEYASHGSLNRYLSSADLTWTQRLRICVDAAKGLSFLHDPNGTQQRVLHCDIKSANILLDKNMTAKVSDFGLSKMGPAYQQYSLVITSAVGTPGYCDPLYMETYSLTKESDVYSFGVVLVEVLCGRQCFEHINGQLKVYVPFWRKIYEENKLDEIILQDLRQQMDPSSLKFFSDIAFQCLRKAREERPTMSRVVEELECALDSQEFPDLRLNLLTKYEAIIKAGDPILMSRTANQLKRLLSEGLVVNESKTLFCINEKGQHIERIYIQACLNSNEIKSLCLQHQLDGIANSRFPGGLYYRYKHEFKARVRGQYLTPQISYTLNLVFRYEYESHMERYNIIRYKFDGEDETKVLIINPATHMREDGWFISPLYHFTSRNTTLDLEFRFDERVTLLLVAGIEFQPSEEKVELQVFEEYQDIIEVASQSLFYTSLDELKQILSKGVHLNGYKTWFCINEKGQHIERIYIQACLNPDETKPCGLRHPLDGIANSRFPGGLCYRYRHEFKARVRGQYLTPKISYTLNLVFRYEYESHIDRYNIIRYKLDGEDETKVLIIYSTTHMREDGWFVAPLYHFTSRHTTFDLEFMFEERGTSLQVAGMEFQPSQEKVELQVFEEYQDIVEVASQSLFYTSLDELKQILSKGVHLNGYKTWFSLNKKGEHCHMISMKYCLIQNKDSTPRYVSTFWSRFSAGLYPNEDSIPRYVSNFWSRFPAGQYPNEDSTPRYVSNFWSRFPAGLYQTNDNGFKTHVKAQLLSPKITYTVNLVCNSSSYGEQVYVDLKYRLRGETTTYTVYLAKRKADEFLWMAELYQFTSDGSIFDLEIIFENSGTNIEGVEGILFQPLEKVEDQLLEDDKVEDIQTIPDLDTYWEQKIPNDYEETLKLSKDSLEYKTWKEIFLNYCKGFLLGNGQHGNDQKWLGVDKNGKKCQMLSARAAFLIDDNNSTWESSNESRFGEVLVITACHKFEIKREIKSDVVLPETNYASYLVYKLPRDQSTFEAPMSVREKDGYRNNGWYIYLVSPPVTPVIGPNIDENCYRPLNRHKLNAVPRHRSDGWMEVKVWQFDTRMTPKTVSMHLKFKHPGKKDLSGLRVQGIELRPV